MTWFAVYDQTTGRLESLGTVVADDTTLARRNLVKLQLAFDPRVPTKQWNEMARDFDNVPEPKPKIGTQEFLDRFTPSEREDIHGARLTAAAEIQKRLNAFLYYIQAADGIDLGDQYIINSVAKMETYGLIGAGRATEILDA